ncbi:hypothetical protein LTR27_005665 [Elasticomyces elasticus]|nr:hypothetical protein LTR27_005665 [Elasticomyces elasticus]
MSLSLASQMLLRSSLVLRDPRYAGTHQEQSLYPVPSADYGYYAQRQEIHDYDYGQQRHTHSPAMLPQPPGSLTSSHTTIDRRVMSVGFGPISLCETRSFTGGGMMGGMFDGANDAIEDDLQLAPIISYDGAHDLIEFEGQSTTSTRIRTLTTSVAGVPTHDFGARRAMYDVSPTPGAIPSMLDDVATYDFGPTRAVKKYYRGVGGWKDILRHLPSAGIARGGEGDAEVPFVTEHASQRWQSDNPRCVELSYATVQGYDCLVEKFRNSAIMRGWVTGGISLSLTPCGHSPRRSVPPSPLLLMKYVLTLCFREVPQLRTAWSNQRRTLTSFYLEEAVPSA